MVDEQILRRIFRLDPFSRFVILMDSVDSHVRRPEDKIRLVGFHDSVDRSRRPQFHL